MSVRQSRNNCNVSSSMKTLKGFHTGGSNFSAITDSDVASRVKGGVIVKVQPQKKADSPTCSDTSCKTLSKENLKKCKNQQSPCSSCSSSSEKLISPTSTITKTSRTDSGQTFRIGGTGDKGNRNLFTSSLESISSASSSNSSSRSTSTQRLKKTSVVSTKKKSRGINSPIISSSSSAATDTVPDVTTSSPSEYKEQVMLNQHPLKTVNIPLAPGQSNSSSLTPTKQKDNRINVKCRKESSSTSSPSPI